MARNSQRKFSVALKIGGGFGLVLLLLIVVGVVSYRGIHTAEEGFGEYRRIARNSNFANDVQSAMLEARMVVKNYLVTSDDANIVHFRKAFDDMKEHLTLAVENIKGTENAPRIKQVAESVDSYDQGFAKVVEHVKVRNDEFANVLNVNGPKIEQALTSILESANKDGETLATYHVAVCMRHLLLGRLYVLKFMESNTSADHERVKQEFASLHESFSQLDKELKNPDRRALLTEAVSHAKAYAESFERVTNAIYERNKIVTGTLDVVGPKVAGLVKDITSDIESRQDILGPAVQKSNATTNTIVIVVSIVAVVIGVFISLLITRGITAPIRQLQVGLGIIANGDLTAKVDVKSRDELGELANEFNEFVDTLHDSIGSVANTAAEVSVAGEQIAEGSQKLAEAASTQASSIEEISASLEEMSSMTQQNADNSNQANSLAQGAMTSANSGKTAMEQMNEAIGRIKQSSDETSKIVKTIDEIAFQTNLLALNAAVEAARAGEAGKGFAVVAEEVRSLAQRSAEAAKTTANLIEGAVKNAESGVAINEQVSAILNEIVEGSTKVNDLISEISVASTEQADGIKQITSAVTQMDQLTQDAAANSEESAAAAS